MTSLVLENALALENVSVVIDGTPIIQNISFRVRPGEIVGLIGPNGAGKTTALRAALGLVPLAGGTIWLDDTPVEDLPLKARAKRIAYMAQGAPVHWPLTAERTVALGRIPHLSPWQAVAAADMSVVEDAMRATDCWQLKDRLVTTLSGGERARVLMARAIAVGAGLLLADEPTASLDPAHQLQVMDILHEQAKSGVGSVVVMHDLSLAARSCDKLILLDKGRVIAKGSSKEVLTDDNIRSAFGIKVARWQEGGVSILSPISRME